MSCLLSTTDGAAFLRSLLPSMKTQIAFAIFGLFALTLIARPATTIRQIDFDNFRYPWPAPAADVPSTWSWLTAAPDSHIETDIV